jgi:hypothetical protein
MEVICTTNADGAAADDQCFRLMVHDSVLGCPWIDLQLEFITKGRMNCK